MPHRTKNILFRIKWFLLYLSVFIFSGLANLAIKCIPFKVLITVLTTDRKPLENPLTRRQEALVRLVNESIENMGHQVPWRMKCFESSLVMLVYARILRVELQVDFGVDKMDDQVSAHAWTSVIGQELTGSEEAKRFTSVYHRRYCPRNLGKY